MASQKIEFDWCISNIHTTILCRFVTESFQTSMGNLIARANASSIMYSQAGTYTCTAERPNEDPVEKTLIVTVQCGKWTSIRNFYSYGW